MRISLNSQILAGALIGIAWGVLLHFLGQDSSFSQISLSLCASAGEIFIDLLKMILIPLVFTSIVTGIVNLKAHAQMQRVWKLTLAYFFGASSLAILLGLTVVNWVKPGIGLSLDLFPSGHSTIPAQSMSVGQFFQSFLSNLFVNPMHAMAEGDVLATVMFAIFFGIALVVLDEKSKNLTRLLNEFFDVLMRMVSWIMVVAPVGIMALLAKLVATQNIQLLLSMGKFIAVVVSTTLVHGLVVLPLLLWLITRTNPLYFFQQMKDSLLTAFSTSSSSATMPVTLRCVEENLQVDKNIAGFVVPLGTTVNMDGTALYEAVAAIFIANLVGIELNLVQQLIVFWTAMIASIGAPGIPSAGMVTMVMVLQSVGLPAEAIAILLPIDRFLDAIRTVVNVEGDAVGSMIVEKLTKRG